MNTTNLFVELIVIGAGALLWLAVAILGVFDVPKSLDSDWISVPALLALLPLVYVLGILVDRTSDWIIDGLAGQQLALKTQKSAYDKAVDAGEPVEGPSGDHTAEEQTYFVRRRTLLHGSPPLFEKLEYTRSRMRICRGWILNFALLGASALVWGFVRPQMEPWVGVLAAVVCIGLATTCYFVWKDLEKTYIQKVHRQGGWLISLSPEAVALGSSTLPASTPGPEATRSDRSEAPVGAITLLAFALGALLADRFPGGG